MLRAVHKNLVIQGCNFFTEINATSKIPCRGIRPKRVASLEFLTSMNLVATAYGGSAWSRALNSIENTLNDFHIAYLTWPFCIMGSGEDGKYRKKFK